MASIIQTANGNWRCQVRKKGQSFCETFATKKAAESWGRITETSIESGRTVANPKKELRGVTLGDIVTRYRDNVSSRKKSKRSEQGCLTKLLRHKICKVPLSELKTSHFAEYRDQRLKEVSPTSLQRELTTLGTIFTVAVDEWDVKLPENPLKKLKFKAQMVERDRRLELGEWEAIVHEAKQRRNPLVLAVVLWAKETGMRLSEVLRMDWRDIDRKLVDRKKWTLVIPDSKNGKSRRLPVTNKMIDILESVDTENDKVFPISEYNIKNTWNRMIKKLGIENLHLHDLRHEAISVLFERGLSIPETASISGHSDWRMLKRYTQVRPENLVDRLNA